MFVKAFLTSAVILGGSLGAASASVLTFNFDDLANNGQKSYSREGFTFDPTNFDSSTHCFPEDGGGNGHCFLETKNGDPTNLTEDNDTTFDLLSFYFNFQGTEGNSLELYKNGANATDDPEDDATFELVLGEAYGGSTNVTIYLDNDLTSEFTGELVQQQGYFVLFDSAIFDGIEMFTWEAQESKQIRIDCVSVSPDGKMDISASDVANCSSPDPIPLPAAGWLLIMAVGGLAVMRQKVT